MMLQTLTEIFSELWIVLKEMSPYLIFGFFVAGLLSVFISPRLVEKHLGGNGILPVIKASLFGVPLPLCSCGVIPVGASLRKSGASKAASISFLISTPQTGVDSIMVTLSLLGPVYAVFRPIAALLTGIFGGGLTALLDKTNGIKTVEAKKNSYNYYSGKGFKDKVIELFDYGFITLPQDIAKPLLIGLIIAALMTVFVPDDMFTGLLGGGIIAMLVMMAVGIPIYVCATASVPIAAALIMKGVSPGAALVFLMTGPATNAATISTIWKIMGKKSAVIYLTSVALGSLAGGLLLDSIYTSRGILPLHHSHWMMPGWIETLSALMLLSILAFTIIKKYLPNKRSTFNETTPGDDMPDSILSVKGMTCNHCAMNVTRAVEECAGVASAQVDLPGGRVKISGTDYDLDRIIKSVEESGYSVVD